MFKISHYLHNTYQSTPWGAENNYSKVSNIEGCSLPACYAQGNSEFSATSIQNWRKQSIFGRAAH